MHLLFDTHAFLCWFQDASELSGKARKAIADVKYDGVFSLASCWKMAIKISLGKLSLTSSLERFVPEQLALSGFRQIAVEFTQFAAIANLPFHHRDSFDRMLAAQTLIQGCAIVSADSIFTRYGVKRIW